MREKTSQWMYYFIIGIISLIALVFLPMVGSEVGLGWAIPNTVVGWIVWVAVKLIIAVINILIFHCFMEQAVVNVKDDPKYIEAKTILANCKKKETLPLAPARWKAQQYGKKGTTLFITTALSTVALTQAILTFDWMSMLTYLFTILMGLIFGVLQMKAAENYWTGQFWEYAKMIEAEEKQQQTIAESHMTEEGYVENINLILEEKQND